MPSVIVGLHRAAISDIGSKTPMALYLPETNERCVENKICGKWKLKGQ